MNGPERTGESASQLPNNNPPPLATSEPAADAVVPPPVARWRWWLHLLVIGLYPALLGLLAAGALERQGPALSGGVKGLLWVCGIEVAIFATIFAVGWVASRATRAELLLTWRPGWWVVPLGVGYSFAIRLAAGLAMVGLMAVLVVCGFVKAGEISQFFTDNRPQIEAVVDMDALRNNPAYFWLTLTLVSFVLAGLREELWRAGFIAGLRGLWPRWFGTKTGQVSAAALGAVIFGLGHLPQGGLAVLITGVLGFCLGLIMLLHRSIWPAVIAHGLFDATSFALIPWAMDLMKETQKHLPH